MSARFYFNLESRHEVIDDENGIEVHDLYAALEKAHEEVAAMRASGELSEAPAGWFLVVRDEEGNAVHRIQI